MSKRKKGVKNEGNKEDEDEQEINTTAKIDDP